MFTSLFLSLWLSCCLLFFLHARDDDVTWCNFLSCSTTRMCDSSNMFTLFFFCACRMLLPSYSYSLKIPVKNVTEKKVSCKEIDREKQLERVRGKRKVREKWEKSERELVSSQRKLFLMISGMFLPLSLSWLFMNMHELCL